MKGLALLIVSANAAFVFTILYPNTSLFNGDSLCETAHNNEYCLVLRHDAEICALQHGPKNLTLVALYQMSKCELKFTSDYFGIIGSNWNFTNLNATHVYLDSLQCNFYGSCLQFVRHHKTAGHYRVSL